VHDGEFLNGTLGDGVALSALMDALGTNTWESTRRNASSGRGNIDPRQSHRRKPALKLTLEARDWLYEALERAFSRCGKIPEREIAELDWPEAPGA
jgi:hypothetical protein